MQLGITEFCVFLFRRDEDKSLNVKLLLIGNAIMIAGWVYTILISH